MKGREHTPIRHHVMVAVAGKKTPFSSSIATMMREAKAVAIIS